jgi:hypothetical protein
MFSDAQPIEGSKWPTCTSRFRKPLVHGIQLQQAQRRVPVAYERWLELGEHAADSKPKQFCRFSPLSAAFTLPIYEKLYGRGIECH